MNQTEADMTKPILKMRLIALGEWLFSQRSWTPVPFILFLAVCPLGETRRDVITWVPGLFLLALGESLRVWAVAVVGKESRTRGSGVNRLVTSGPYAFVRNPLYLGNFLLTLGATFVSELLWMVPVVVLLYAFQYTCIVRWEEHILSERFGAEYLAYCQRVPCWIPRLSHRAHTGPVPYQWRAALWSERSTLTTLTVLLLVMSAKENLQHLPKFLDKHGVQVSPVLQKVLKGF